MTGEPQRTAMPPDTTDDAFLGGTLNILQPARGHRSGLDAVLLAASVAAGEGETVLDLGCGAGVAGLCLLARVPDTHALLLDSDEAMLALANSNIARNGFAGRARAVRFDIEGRGGVAAAGIAQGTVDHVLANPPFFDAAGIRATPDEAKRSAHVAGNVAALSRADSLARWASFAAGALRKSGTFTLIHRADALADILPALAGRFGAIAVTPIHPRPDVGAIRVVVRATKASRAPLTIRAGIVLHPPSGEAFEPHIDAVLRGPLAL